jgi:hypothetical protein
LGTDIENLAALIAANRETAARAHRLALSVDPDDPARPRLLAMAEELDKEREKLEARHAVLRQEAAQGSQEVEPPIAAMKPSDDTDPEPTC